MANQGRFNISSLELAISMISLMLGAGVLTLPRSLAESTGTGDGWIAIIIAGMLMTIFIYFYIRLQRKIPGQDLFEFISVGPIGRWGSKLLAFVFILHFITIVATLARTTALAVKMYLLDKTPSEVLVAVILLLIVYASTKGIQGMVHLNLMFIPVILFALLILLVCNIGNAELVEIRPVLAEGIAPVLLGVVPSMFSFSSVSILFIFMAHMNKDQLRLFPLLGALSVVTLFYSAIVLMCFMVFSVDSVKLIVFPGVELAKQISLAGEFIERLESIFLTVWTMAIFTSMHTLQVMAVTVIKRSFLKEKGHFWIHPALVFVIFIVAFIPNSIVELEAVGSVLSYIEIVLISLGLLAGYSTVLIRKGKSQSSIN